MIPPPQPRVLSQFTHEEYRQAAQSYLNVKTASAVRTKEEDTSPDFAEEKPQEHLDYAMPPFQLTARSGRIGFAATPDISGSILKFIPRRSWFSGRRPRCALFQATAVNSPTPARLSG